uniref:Uncharacterized protein n=1 Tax=Tanacetum cinerariifolium TaxID=118510 RepID=A0A6L2LRS7_TANCI|nr:hypothetical protein [Tanacetum cinerariifolium]
MGESLSPDHVFDFPEDKPEPHPAYDFFLPWPLPGYAGNPNKYNGWLEADDYLLGELKDMMNELMAVPAIEEVAEPVVEAEEEQVIAPVVDIEEEQMAALVVDIKEELAALFGEDDDFEDDDFSDDDSKGVEEEEPSSVYVVGGPSTVVAEGPSFPHLSLGLFVPLFVIEDLCTRLGNLEYGHGQLVQRVNQVSDAEVAVGVTIGQLGPRIYVVKGQVQALQINVQQRAHRSSSCRQQLLRWVAGRAH